MNDPYDSLNPFNARYSSSFTAMTLMYPNLVEFSSALEAIPDLADSWESSADGLTWTFKLHPGAVWTDGEPITAADVVFTIETVLKYKDDASAYLNTFIPVVTGATAVDDTTVELTLSAPSATLLSDMYMLPILPEHVWAPLATGDGSQLKTPINDPAKEDVVVAGPFTIEKLDLKGTSIYRRVDTFYGTKPLITGYGFQLFTNADAAVQALKTDQIDAAYFLPASSATAFQEGTGFTVQGFGQLPWFLAPNCSKNYTAHPEMQDPKVRQAFSLAVDRQPLIDAVNRGFAASGGWPLLDAYVPQFLSQPMTDPGSGRGRREPAARRPRLRQRRRRYPRRRRREDELRHPGVRAVAGYGRAQRRAHPAGLRRDRGGGQAEAAGRPVHGHVGQRLHGLRLPPDGLGSLSRPVGDADPLHQRPARQLESYRVTRTPPSTSSTTSSRRSSTPRSARRSSTRWPACCRTSRSTSRSTPGR